MGRAVYVAQVVADVDIRPASSVEVDDSVRRARGVVALKSYRRVR